LADDTEAAGAVAGGGATAPPDVAAAAWPAAAPSCQLRQDLNLQLQLREPHHRLVAHARRVAKADVVHLDGNARQKR
jgi:hypothetical protein